MVFSIIFDGYGFRVSGFAFRVGGTRVPMCVNPNPEIRVPKEIRNPKIERAHRTRQLRASAFGLLSDFGPSDLGFERHVPGTRRIARRKRGRHADECSALR